MRLFFSKQGIWVVVFITITGISCRDTAPPPNINPAPSNVAFFHASPDAPDLDLFVDDTQILLGDDGKFDYLSYIPYTELSSIGTHQVRYMTALEDPLLEHPLNVSEDYFTVFLIGSEVSIDKLILKDVRLPSDPNLMRIRFINLAPDSPALDIYMNSGKVVSAQAYKEYTDFRDVQQGVYTFSAVQANTEDDPLVIAEDVFLLEGVHYTFLIVGYYDPEANFSTNSLSLHLIANP